MSGFGRKYAGDVKSDAKPVVAESSPEDEAEDGEKRSKPVYVVGVIMSVSSKTWTGGWTIGKLEHIDTDGKKTISAISGKIAGLRKGDEVEVVGSFVQNPNYGYQLEIEHATRVLPKKNEAIEKWIIENLPDIGPERAKALVDLYGPQLFEILDGDDWLDALTYVPGITDERAIQIWMAYREKKHQFALFNFLVELGLSSREIKAVFKQSLGQADIESDLFTLYYKRIVPIHRLVEVLERIKPELLESDGFSAAMIHHTLKQCTEDGSTAVPMARARKELFEVLDVVPPDAEILRVVGASKGRIAVYNGLLLPGELARDEETIARFIRGNREVKECSSPNSRMTASSSSSARPEASSPEGPAQGRLRF